MKYVAQILILVLIGIGAQAQYENTYLVSPHLSLSGDGSIAAVSGRSVEDISARNGFRYPIDFYNTETGEFISSYGASEGNIGGLSLNSDGKLLVYSTTDGEVTIVNLANGNQPEVLLPGGFVEVGYPVWNPAGTEIAVSFGAGLQFYNSISNLRLQFVGDENASRIPGFDWSANGKTIAYTKFVGGDPDGILFAVQLDEQFHSSIVREISISTSLAIALNANGNLVATTSQEGIIVTFLDDETQRILSDNGLQLGITSLDWSPDGSRIVAGANELIVVWDVETGDILETMQVDSIAYDVTWSPDGQHLYYSGEPAGIYRDGLPLQESIANSNPD
ncbi:WD40 repeat domain-containing protein [Phototrophicus methaneseepsis]|uniref:WD40 repeat domain-containing protein n=1 Tax=Phototrophicus methaneseepsis TaxID=2710758 RepID=A0A7S8E804_9CHLR|nr:WD40 repeat domain-containing protein [Phototrophicus methaneseepsis]QPC82040.1 WD40 repeat domain-containing protein [Phototrophicus methaneseepsis]